jgi:hypothetical protein
VTLTRNEREHRRQTRSRLIRPEIGGEGPDNVVLAMTPFGDVASSKDTAPFPPSERAAVTLGPCRSVVYAHTRSMTGWGIGSGTSAPWGR